MGFEGWAEEAPTVLGELLDLEATTESHLFGVRPLWDGAPECPPRKAQRSVPGEGGWPAVATVLRQAGLIYHLGVRAFLLSPDSNNPLVQNGRGEWGPAFGNTSFRLLGPSYHRPVAACVTTAVTLDVFHHTMCINSLSPCLCPCCLWCSIEILGIRASKEGSGKRERFLSFWYPCGK